MSLKHPSNVTPPAAGRQQLPPSVHSSLVSSNKVARAIRSQQTDERKALGEPKKQKRCFRSSPLSLFSALSAWPLPSTMSPSGNNSRWYSLHQLFPRANFPASSLLPSTCMKNNYGHLPLLLFGRYHPWRAPGYAPTVDPCGMGGAYLRATEGGIAPQGSTLFARGSELPVGPRTNWTAGHVVEVGWMVGSNHGGGYLYSLCPAGEALTEQCFQMGALPFVGAEHTIRYLDNKTEFPIPAMDISEGTWPKGSAWRRNPIPACNCDQGDECDARHAATDLQRAYADDGPPNPKGDATNGNDCPTGTQFPVPFPYGYGQHLWYNSEHGPSRDMWAIVDTVQVRVFVPRLYFFVFWGDGVLAATRR